jgi:outer membrane protein OmpA-like peptidoglycan-associated protein
MFDGNTARLNSKSKRTLKGVAQLILENPRIRKIRIDVHTHNVGGPAKSKELGLQRAETIRSILNQYGVSKSRVRSNSYGMSKNIALNLTQKGRKKNQRVLFAITQVN